MTSEPVDLDKLEALLAAGTPGRAYYDQGPGSGGYRYRVMVGGVVIGGVHRESSAALIVALHNQVPALIAEVKRLRWVEESADAMHTATNRLLGWLVGAKMQVSPATFSIVEGLNDAAEAYDAAKKGEV